METKEFKTVQVSNEAALFVKDLRENDHDYYFREKDGIADAFSLITDIDDNQLSVQEKERIRRTLTNYNALLNALAVTPDD